MSVSRDLRAFAIGLTVFVTLYAVDFLVLAQTEHMAGVGEVVVAVGYAIPVIAGGVTAFFCGGRDFASVAGVGIFGSLLVALLNALAALFGMPTDFSGWSSVPLVAVLSLFVQVPLALIGGAVVGKWLRPRRA